MSESWINRIKTVWSQEGYDSYGNGISLSDNPYSYTYNHDSYIEWTSGWQKAHEEDHKKQEFNNE